MFRPTVSIDLCYTLWPVTKWLTFMAPSPTIDGKRYCVFRSSGGRPSCHAPAVHPLSHEAISWLRWNL